MKETDLFEPVKNFLIESDMEVYTEVPCGRGRADIVAVKHNLVTIIELKTSLSLQLLVQAYHHISEAHYVYTAVPRPKNRYFNQYAQQLLRRDGIGLIAIDLGVYSGAQIYHKAKLHRQAKVNWAKDLNDGYRYQNNLAGGTCGGGYWTPYSEMIKQVRRYIERKRPNPVSIKDIIDQVDIVTKHYVQPKSGIYGALTKIEKDWCESVKINGQTCFKLRD